MSVLRGLILVGTVLAAVPHAVWAQSPEAAAGKALCGTLNTTFLASFGSQSEAAIAGTMAETALPPFESGRLSAQDTVLAVLCGVSNVQGVFSSDIAGQTAAQLVNRLGATSEKGRALIAAFLTYAPDEALDRFETSVQDQVVLAAIKKDLVRPGAMNRLLDGLPVIENEGSEITDIADFRSNG